MLVIHELNNKFPTPIHGKDAPMYRKDTAYISDWRNAREIACRPACHGHQNCMYLMYLTLSSAQRRSCNARLGTEGAAISSAICKRLTCQISHKGWSRLSVSTQLACKQHATILPIQSSNSPLAADILPLPRKDSCPHHLNLSKHFQQEPHTCMHSKLHSSPSLFPR